MLLRILTLAFASCIHVAHSGASAPPAFPGAEGFGASSLGARGCGQAPVVLVVDDLGDAERDGCPGDGLGGRGACTLREALATQRPRFVVFNVSGTIVLDWEKKKNLRLQAPESCVTVAGQTSPSGITIANGSIQLEGGFRHGIFRHLRIRPGVWPSKRRLISGCNRWELRCAENPGVSCSKAGRDPVCGAPPDDRCRPVERANWGKGPCPKCDIWRNRLARGGSPDDWSGCNDAFLRGGSSSGAFLVGESRYVIVDHLSATWASDQTFDVYVRRGGASDITVSNTLIAASHASTSEHPGHREAEHNYGSIIGGRTTQGLERLTLVKNLWAHHRKRVPKITGGRVQFVYNVEYNNRAAPLFQNKHDTLVVDVMYNLHRLGPDALRRRQGRCSDGRVCLVDGHCKRGPCSLSFPYFLNLHSPLDLPGSLHLRGNRFEVCGGLGVPCSGWVEAPAPGAPALDRQWDAIAPSGDRPLDKERISNRAWYWSGRHARGRRVRRDEPMPSPRHAVEHVDPASLWETLAPHIGASLPARDRVDADIVESVTEGLGLPESSRPVARHCLGDPDRRSCSSDAACRGLSPATCGFLPGHFAYPGLAPIAAPRIDTDRDGIPDAWESAHGVTEALSDDDGDGYPNVEEWMNGSDPRASDVASD